MSRADEEREQAGQLPEGDVVGMLLEQHARIRDLFSQVQAAHGDDRREAFDQLRVLLAVHETAEEMIVRPVAKKTAGAAEAEARNQEEAEANKVLAQLEKMDLESAEFERKFAEFERAVAEHADQEEREEFPAIRAGRSEEQLKQMGSSLRVAEATAPTHPHPSAAGKPAAQWAVGPFVSMVDRTRDAINAARSKH
ncbi:hemerythrin domain-containing protein [Streptomyces carpaticus]|uniref:Hemerythrin HHE cation binding domain-containing protein n=3 Tax=Streptomyces TaxID=1883 RepID=A0A1I6PAB1_9ACTN|nr:MULTISPECIES: hemerythrin domain-containing protein [Streptomyces]MCK1815110.1 hemerythrin domain-containing protein [Streptomyces sp. XM4011]QKV71676.1 hemerythrin domain-containing protein [Streptomyces harbinensis]UWM52169.1 hemerythrin domain-containing protein [Streptomyces carpaticus]SFS37134.1 Hemerythrin HHE cation binding domain-containing protein [Streptomyces harbinensis]